MWFTVSFSFYHKKIITYLIILISFLTLITFAVVRAFMILRLSKRNTLSYLHTQIT